MSQHDYVYPNRKSNEVQNHRSLRKRRGFGFLFILAGAVTLFLAVADQSEIGRKLPFVQQKVEAVTELHPVVAEKSEQLVAQAADRGIRVIISQGFRSHEEQDALYAQGRTTDGPVVTQVSGGQSYHNYGLAIDFALLTPNGKAIWDLEYDGNQNGRSDWMEVVDLAKALGFTWGGDWVNFPDYPHLQMDFGYTIDELQRGFRPE